MNDKDVNVIFDTVTGCSVIDVGSLEYIGLGNLLQKPKRVF